MTTNSRMFRLDYSWSNNLSSSLKGEFIHKIFKQLLLRGVGRKMGVSMREYI